MVLNMMETLHLTSYAKGKEKWLDGGGEKEEGNKQIEPQLVRS